MLLTAFWFQYSGFCFVLLCLSFILNPCLLLNQMFGFVCSNRVRIMSYDLYYCTLCKCFHLHITQELLSHGNHCRFCADVNTSGGLELLLAELWRFLLTMFLNFFLRVFFLATGCFFNHLESCTWPFSEEFSFLFFLLRHFNTDLQIILAPTYKPVLCPHTKDNSVKILFLGILLPAVTQFVANVIRSDKNNSLTNI